jgi:hypothetical protein
MAVAKNANANFLLRISTEVGEVSKDDDFPNLMVIKV